MFRYYCHKEVNGLTRQYYPSSKITAWVGRLLKTYIERAKIVWVRFKPIQSVDHSQLKMIQLKHTFRPVLELLSFKRAHPRGYVKQRETSLSPKFCSSSSDRHGKSKTKQPAPLPPNFCIGARLFGATQLLIKLPSTVNIVYKRVHHSFMLLRLRTRAFSLSALTKPPATYRH